MGMQRFTPAQVCAALMAPAVLTLALCLGLAGPRPAWAGFQEGMAAYLSGDFLTALKEWQPLAQQGDVEAQHGLGRMYFRGEGVPENYSEARRWFEKAAAGGYGYSMHGLGVLYDNGWGVSKSAKEAVKWYRQAANAGVIEAQSRLAECYGKGTGISVDPSMAYYWASIAAANPYATKQLRDEAKGLREQYEKRLTRNGVLRAQNKTRDWAARNPLLVVK